MWLAYSRQTANSRRPVWPLHYRKWPVYGPHGPFLARLVFSNEKASEQYLTVHYLEVGLKTLPRTTGHCRLQRYYSVNCQKCLSNALITALETVLLCHVSCKSVYNCCCRSLLGASSPTSPCAAAMPYCTVKNAIFHVI